MTATLAGQSLGDFTDHQLRSAGVEIALPLYGQKILELADRPVGQEPFGVPRLRGSQYGRMIIRPYPPEGGTPNRRVAQPQPIYYCETGCPKPMSSM